ncbi:ATP-grasp domain-containing protein [Roseateles sp.]|uniref:ATP-grasp domain-containing protein n=1 Tax=Roseateles sp. TaxID=1971397 RepID=UPI003BA7431B
MSKPEALWLISGGPMQLIAATRAKQRGLALVLSDGNPEAPCRSLADQFIHLDTFDVQGHIDASASVTERFDVKAVITTAADCHTTVNNLAKHLGLHHLAPEISEICRNKALTRARLTQAGLPQPGFTMASTFEQARSYLAEASCDHVIKATDNSGSRGFSVVPLGQALSEAQFQEALTMGSTGQVVIEERLRPHPEQVSEASVETLWQDGRLYWINWVDRIFPRDLHFFPQIHLAQIPKESIEIGHINPARRHSDLKDQVRRDIEAAGRAIGMAEQKGAHILKADIYFSDRGPVILELTPRTSGGWDSSGSSMARGAEIADGVIHMGLGRRVDLNDWFKYFEFTHAENTVVVVTKIPENAADCIGRQFAMAQGCESTDALFNKAYDKLNNGAFHVPVL